ncbi:hypothetical protein ACFWAR_37575 [Streptomyces sp. NPDC059917]|uniref:hypothetical protein n=1 Tax=Streptomyces sp. NPDC059917 TaxID=3347002 RepID=UPI00365DB81D
MAVGSRARSMVLGGVSALVIGGLLPATAMAAPAPDAGAPRWSAAELPGGDAVLSASVKPDAHTTWAAGFRVDDDGGGVSFRPVLYAHDDRRGGAWTERPTAPGVSGRVNAIAATSDRDAWLVGDADGEGQPAMTQHWDGRAWREKPAAMPDNSLGGGLLGVAAVAPNDVWAAGWTQALDERIPDPDGSTQIIDHMEGLVQHWDGRAWKRAELPKGYANWGLNAISASGPNDVWAVGSGYGDDDRPVVLHYDGRSWKQLPTPPYGGLYGEFNSVVANGPGDVWAVGRTILDENDRGHALIMHWNGRTWTRVAGPAEAGSLTGVAAAPGGVVAVGRILGADGGFALRVSGSRVTSLGFPASTAQRSYAPWTVAATGREVTVSGSARGAGGSGPLPLLLTTRL